MTKRYREFKKSIKPENRRTKTTQTGIVEEYKMLVDIRTIIDEINILQPLFDEQHSMARKLLKWVDSKILRKGLRNIPSGDNQADVASIGSDAGNSKQEEDAVSDQTEILKKRVQWLKKDSERILNSV